MRADIIKCWKIFQGKCSIKPIDIFVFPTRAGTRGHKFKITHGNSKIECRRRFFSLRVVEIWNALPSEVVELDSVSAFKTSLLLCLGDRLFEFVE